MDEQFGTHSLISGMRGQRLRGRNRRRPSAPRRAALGASVTVFYSCVTPVKHRRYAATMATTIGFRPTDEDERIIRAAMRPDEHISDVIRRALRLLEREVWLCRARSDAERLAREDLTDEADAW